VGLALDRDGEVGGDPRVQRFVILLLRHGSILSSSSIM